MKKLMQSQGSKAFSLRKLTLSALLCAIALTIFVIEAQIPLPIPLPGVKLGLANVITLIALLILNEKYAFMILVARILLGTLFAGQPLMLLYSLSGGIVSLGAEAFLLKLWNKNFIVEVSIIGAMVHNAIQILCAVLLTQTPSIFWYLPPLLIVAFVTGAFCGLCALFAYKYLGKYQKNS